MMYKVGDIIQVKISNPEIESDKIINGQTGVIESRHKNGLRVRLETGVVVLLEPDEMKLKV